MSLRDKIKCQDGLLEMLIKRPRYQVPRVGHVAVRLSNDNIVIL